MTAAVIAVGSELLRAGRSDTNAVWLTARLAALGVETVWRAAVEDDASRIARLIEAAFAESQVVLVTGGLGPTDDDRTRAGLAIAVREPLERDAAMEVAIAERFRRYGRVAGPMQFRQADRPRGSSFIDNPIGSAPGILVEREGRVLAALPGVPAEMKAMFDASVAGRIAASDLGGSALVRRVLRVAGRPESVVEETVGDLYATSGTDTTILSSAGVVDLVLTARGGTREEAGERVAALEAAMRGRLGRDVYGTGDDTLASVTGRLLAERGATVAVGESCTGGLLGGAFTDVPGSSRWFRGGIVAYADDVKTALAGVPTEILRDHGAVSEEVARALARGARQACRAAIGLGVTGIAGPEGGSPEKPVGLVHLALDDGGPGRAVRLDWPGDRDLIRRRAVAVALDLLRRHLLPS